MRSRRRHLVRAASISGDQTDSDGLLRADQISVDEGLPSSTSLFEVGIQHFESGLFRSPNRTRSLGEIALLYRQRHGWC